MPAPRLQPGQKDGRAKNSAPKKDQKDKRANRVQVNLTEAEYEWLEERGGKGWFLAQLQAAMGK